jgi:hypothetical protein
MILTMSPPPAKVLPEIWNSAPDERCPAFFKAFAVVSLAVQRRLRECVPELFLADTEIFAHPSLVYPMLMYAASRPFRPRSRTELTYDALDDSWIGRFANASKRSLAPLLQQVHDRLEREQSFDDIRSYRPRRAAQAIRTVRKLKKSQSLLLDLVAGEAALVNDLVQLAGLAALPPLAREKQVARFFRNFENHLRRMFRRCDLTPLAPLLLQTASEALEVALATELAA